MSYAHSTMPCQPALPAGTPFPSRSGAVHEATTAGKVVSVNVWWFAKAKGQEGF